MPRLYFLRHGETDWNRVGRLQGNTETALNARGRAQASLLSQHLRAIAGDRLADLPFYASPMRRTRQTMEILREGLGLEREAYAAVDRLREIGFGAWEGRSWPEIRTRDPIGARDRDLDRWTFCPPGGESYEMVSHRVAGWLETIDHDCCIVSHGGIARVMMVLRGGFTPAEAVEADIWQGKVLFFDGAKAKWLPGPGHG
ncbi:MAG TPA: histidine phosphatase family protein [Rhabdaerophilum sp.]|nr:histidine phosphatase family protein [Rhabdaerophilum sp.]